MAMYSSNQSKSKSNSWILSVKIALISTGVLSMAVALKISVPVVAGFVTSEVPSFWSFLLSWLKPPYLYVVINFIIIGIVASSKLQHKSSAAEDPPPPTPIAGAAEKIPGAYGGVALSGYGYDASEVAANVEEAGIVYSQARAVEPARVSESAVSEFEERIKDIETVAVVESGGDEAVVASSFAWNGLQRKDSVEFSLNENERPPLSARFGHKKSIKSSPEGGKSLLRVSKPKKQDTFENTWKTITEGRPMPLTRHLKKSDTWESHARRHQQQNDQNTPPPPPMKKSETLSEKSSLTPSPNGSGKIRREPSLSQDDLNRRVEAFIKKFNEEMRLQRQESLNQYQEMIRSGVH